MPRPCRTSPSCIETSDVHGMYINMYINMIIYQRIYYIYMKFIFNKNMWENVGSDILQHTSHLKPIKPKQIRKICLDVYPKWNHDHITIIQYITIHNNLW
jgi:hypothetical protein